MLDKMLDKSNSKKQKKTSKHSVYWVLFAPPLGLEPRTL